MLILIISVILALLLQQVLCITSRGVILFLIIFKVGYRQEKIIVKLIL